MKLLLIIPFVFAYVFVQAQTPKVKISAVKESKSFDTFKKKYEGGKSELHDFKYSPKERSSNPLTQKLSECNSVVSSPTKQSAVAFFDGPAPSKYAVFLDKNARPVSSYEVSMSPIVNYSQNGEYVVLYCIMANKLFCFTKEGTLLYKSHVSKLVSGANTLYNCYVDNEGKNLLVNTTNRVSLFNITKKSIVWTKKTDDRRISECVFNYDKDVVIISSLLDVEKWKGRFKYRVLALSLASGEHIWDLPHINDLNIKGNNFLLRQNDDKWKEYEIK